MKSVILVLAALTAILSTASFALADDCEYVSSEKVCWDSGSGMTLSWTYAKSTVGKYQIEARDFNWLGSVFLRVIHNNTVKEGMISEGEAYVFDFTNGTGFEGIKIVADQVSNINPMPANIGVYPSDPVAKITVRSQEAKEKKTPSLGMDISIEGEAKTGSRITAYIKTENSGDADLAGMDITIYYDGLKLMRDYDLNNGLFSEDTLTLPEIEWENVSKYRLTPVSHTIVREGFFIDVLNFSDKAIISASYNRSSKTDTLIKGRSIIFNFTEDKIYRGVKIQGINISSDAAELVLQFPAKNMLKRSYNSISKGSSESIKLGFLIPVSSKRIFTITASASGKDDEGAIYTALKSLTLSASNALGIKKTVTNSILGEKMYTESYYGVGGIRSIRNITYVTIRVDNLQTYPVYGIKLEDSIPPSFNFPEDANKTSISWVLDMNAGDNREFKYEIKAKRQGVYNLPRAGITWNEWGEEMRKESESPRTTVSGPYIGIERSFSKSSLNIGETLQVTLSIINNGDIPANVTVKESVPRNATHLSGGLSFSGFLNPGEQGNIVYNISLYREGTLEFGSPEINSRNQGFDWYSPLPDKKVQFLQQPSTASPAATAIQAGNAHVNETGLIQRIDEKIPWLEGAISIITFLFAIFLLLTLKN